MKKLLALVLALVMVCGFTACNNNNGTGEETANADAVSWYMMFPEQEDLQLVEDELNNRISEKLGTTVDIMRLDPAAYNQKTNVMFASGEVFDLCWMSPGAGYYNYATKGALMPMNDLIAEYAPLSYAAVPEKFWDAARVDGEIYGFLNYQIVGRQFGFVMDQEMVKAANFDYESMTNYKDIEPLLSYVHENHPDDIAYGRFNGSSYSNHFNSWGMIPITELCCFRADDENITVLSSYEQPEYLELCKSMRDWYEKGYIEPDAATITNNVELRKGGKIKCWFDMTGPGFEPTFEAGTGGRPVYTKVVVDPLVTSENIIATMNSISATSKKPEKAMQLLEMVNQNEEDIYNLLCFGIEGKHYTKVGENRIELAEDTKYYPNIAWAWGNQFNAYLMPGQPDNLWEMTKELNANADISPLMGFCFNSEPVKTQVSQLTSVVDEYDSILGTGTVEPTEKYDEFIAKLKAAGIDDVVAEMQRQIDEWRAGQEA